MPSTIYMDANVPRAITSGLRLRGVRVITAQEDGTANIEDAALLDRVTALGFVLYTQDDDLLAEAHLRQNAGVSFAGVVYSHQMRSPIGRCVEDLEIIAKTQEASEMINRVEFVPF